jgi:hypothetical protein
VTTRPHEPPDTGNGFCGAHARLLVDSFRRCTGRALIIADGAAPVGDDELGRRLFEAPFAVLSHAPGADPHFTYANGVALRLFEVDWAALLRMPSRLSAEPVEQAERARLLARVRDRGFIDDYEGIRISRSGRRFRITGAVVWTVTDGAGVDRGQAATFAEWQPLS